MKLRWSGWFFCTCRSDAFLRWDSYYEYTWNEKVPWYLGFGNLRLRKKNLWIRKIEGKRWTKVSAHMYRTRSSWEEWYPTKVATWAPYISYGGVNFRILKAFEIKITIRNVLHMYSTSLLGYYSSYDDRVTNVGTLPFCSSFALYFTNMEQFLNSKILATKISRYFKKHQWYG